ncbi:MAG: Nramp family divalent metal transporter [Candidatus Hodarchaeota archaeon]
MVTDKEFTGIEDIPEPFEVKSWRDYMKFLIGPGIIALGLGLGTGELVSGPYLIVKHGPLILWVALISIFLQTVTAISASKYTILTGEPFQIGLNRLWFSKKAWTAVWIVLGTLSAILPYYPALLGVTFVAIMINDVPTSDQQFLWIIFTIIALVIILLPLFLGKKVMKTLGLMFFIIHFLIIIPLLIIITLLTVPVGTIFEVFTGFFYFGYLPEGADWLALGAVAGFAGLAASAGMSISAYYRDTGWGMAKRLGHIPGALGGEKVEFLVKGYMPKVDEENQRRAKTWYKFILLELVPIFFFGSLITMVFPCVLYYYFVPTGAATENIFGFTSALAQNLGLIIAFAWPLILIMFALVFFADGTGVIDGLMRQFANIIWNTFPSLHDRFKGDVRPVYYGVLGIFIVIWLIVIIIGTPPVTMVLLAGSLANIGGVIFSAGLLAVNYQILPKEYRFSIIEVIVICVSIVFYGFFLLKAFYII